MSEGDDDAGARFAAQGAEIRAKLTDAARAAVEINWPKYHAAAFFCDQYDAAVKEIIEAYLQSKSR